MTYEEIKDFIQNKIPFDSIEKSKGIYEFDFIDEITIGVSFEDLEYFKDFILKDVYIFNLFIGEEYIDISGAYRMKGNEFVCIDAINTKDGFIKEIEIELDIFKETLDVLESIDY